MYLDLIQIKYNDKNGLKTIKNLDLLLRSK